MTNVIHMLKDLGLDRFVVPIAADARSAVKEVSALICFMLIDAVKEEYHEYLSGFEDKLVRGSIIMAHNTVAPFPEHLERYLAYCL